MTGSIACYKACGVISKLVQNGFEVKIACTKSALEFVGISTLEGLTRKKAYTDMFHGDKSLEHVDLSKWLDLAIICPATGNILNKLAAGIADDCVSTLFLAHDFSKPFLIAPAMNRNMYEHPATKRSIATLKSWGVRILDTESGYQACGDTGPGRLLEPGKIYEEIVRACNEII